MKARFNAENVTNEKGKVLYQVSENGRRWYPYKWDPRIQAWNECAGVYTPGYIRKLENAGAVRFYTNK